MRPAEMDLGPSPGAPVDLVLESWPHSVATARHAVGRMLQATRLIPLELAEDVVLLVSELVANAVLHAGTAVRLRASTEEGRVLVAVGDDDPDHAPRPAGCGLTATSGRGLMLVDMLATSWGVEVFETSKVVWFEAGSRPGTGRIRPRLA